MYYWKVSDSVGHVYHRISVMGGHVQYVGLSYKSVQKL